MSMTQVLSYKDLIVWQKSMKLAVEVYKLTNVFLKSEIYGLISQMRRSAVSIPSNIAEGSRRATRKDYRHFLRIGYGSGAELETQIELSKQLYKIDNINYGRSDELLNEIMRILNRMIQSLK